MEILWFYAENRRIVVLNIGSVVLGNSGNSFEFNVSEDKIEFYGNYIPQESSGINMDFQSLQTLLESEKIIYGIDEKRMKEFIEKVQNQIPVKNFLLAKGKMPKKSSSSYIHLKPRLFHPPELPDKSLSMVDYRMVSPFVMVKKDEILGRIIEEAMGEEGINVFGERIVPGQKDIKQLEAGENTQQEEGVVKAKISGRFVLDKNRFSVSDTLIIEGNVDYATGHISFAGDVIIHGEIKDGFRVAAGGGVYCKKTLDASELLCRKDLIIEGGIKGRNTGLVRVQGKVETRFIENCHVESQQGISVKSSILDSEIYTLGELLLGEKKGTIIGGVCYAEKGITTENIGSSRSSHTLIYCGISYMNMRQLKHREKRLDVLNKKMDQLRALPPSEDHEQLIEKAKKAKEILQQGIGNYLVEQYTDFSAEIMVKGTAYPGTEITICDRHLTITEAIANKVFYYDNPSLSVAFRDI